MQNGSPTGKESNEKPKRIKRNFISLHIPKTGGTIFVRRVLRTNFIGVKNDYQRFPLKRKYECPDLKDIPHCRIMHGHFPASKYLSWNLPYVTWLRNPIDRLISHYNYSNGKKWWKIADAVAWGKNLDDYIEENTNVISKFIDIPIYHFIFIGIVERWQESLKRFAWIMDIDLDRYMSDEFMDNVKKMYAEKSKNYLRASNDQIKRIKELNKEDIEFYETERSRYD